MTAAMPRPPGRSGPASPAGPAGPDPGPSAGEVPGAGLASVVMVSFRTGPELHTACSTALADPAVRELVLVDNGNPPDTMDWMDRLAASSPDRVRVVRGHGNVGFGRACNLGAALARAPVLVFLNPDTSSPPGMLGRLAAQAAGRRALVGALVTDPQGREQQGARRGPLTPATLLVELSGLKRPGSRCEVLRGFNRQGEPVPDRITPQATVSGACLALPADLFGQLEGFDPRYFLHFEDVELCRRARLRGIPVLVDPSVIVNHKGATSQASAWRIGWAKLHSLLIYLFASVRR